MAVIETITVGNTTYNVGSPLSSTGLPIGTIISFMGNVAPLNYLECNGQTVNIADYPDLSDFFAMQFGSNNYFGGDGTTTIAVPDLRGEFLRGTGTNSHSYSGSGASVGTHQTATHLNVGWANNAGAGFSRPETASATYYDFVPMINYDNSYTAGARTSTLSGSDLKFKANTTAGNVGYRGIRPTNTSVLYCILAK